MTILFIIIYLIISIGNYILSMNYWRNEFPKIYITKDDYIVSLLAAMVGPFGTLIIFKDAFKHLDKLPLYIFKKDK